MQLSLGLDHCRQVVHEVELRLGDDFKSDLQFTTQAIDLYTCLAGFCKMLIQILKSDLEFLPCRSLCQSQR